MRRQDMRRLMVFSILTICMLVSGCDIWLYGTAKRGYEIEFDVRQLQADAMESIDKTILTNRYILGTKGRKSKAVAPYDNPNEKASDYFNSNLKVYIHLFYAKNDKSNNYDYFQIRVKNWRSGGIDKQLYDEINRMYEIIYGELLKYKGKDEIVVTKLGDVVKKGLPVKK